MRSFYISILLLFIISNSASAQTTGNADTSSRSAAAPVTLRIRCGTLAPGPEPLYVVDGYPYKAQVVKEFLDPDNIESISVLKGTDVQAIYGSPAMNGVIIITTKKSWVESFYAVDAEDDSPLVGATITFISDDGRDSLRFAADEEGGVHTKLFAFGKNYKVVVSSVGHKDLLSNYKRTKEKTLVRYRMSRDVKETAPVVVVGYGRTIGCTLTVCYSKVTTCEMNTTSIESVVDNNQYAGSIRSRVYPNPVIRGSFVQLELELKEEATVKTTISNLTGAVLSSVSYRSVKGLNRVELPVANHWASGVYFIQVTGANGRLLKQEKLIIQ